MSDIYPELDERDAELKEEKAGLVSLVEGLRKDGIKASAFMKEAVVSAGMLEFAENLKMACS